MFLEFSLAFSASLKLWNTDVWIEILPRLGNCPFIIFNQHIIRDHRQCSSKKRSGQLFKREASAVCATIWSITCMRPQCNCIKCNNGLHLMPQPISFKSPCIKLCWKRYFRIKRQNHVYFYLSEMGVSS